MVIFYNLLVQDIILIIQMLKMEREIQQELQLIEMNNGLVGRVVLDGQFKVFGHLVLTEKT
jgi:hypothetical protein